MRLPFGIRKFNRDVLNRLTGKIARSAHGPFVIVQHTGRKSGKPYETPIIAIPAADGFVIALTYGPEVDWFKNISAAGKCGILRHKQQYAVSSIQPLSVPEALAYFPGIERVILRIVGIQRL